MTVINHNADFARSIYRWTADLYLRFSNQKGNEVYRSGHFSIPIDEAEKLHLREGDHIQIDVPYTFSKARADGAVTEIKFRRVPVSEWGSKRAGYTTLGRPKKDGVPEQRLKFAISVASLAFEQWTLEHMQISVELYCERNGNEFWLMSVPEAAVGRLKLFHFNNETPTEYPRPVDAPTKQNKIPRNLIPNLNAVFERMTDFLEQQEKRDKILEERIRADRAARQMIINLLGIDVEEEGPLL